MKANRALTFLFFAFALFIVIYSFQYSARARFGPLLIGIPAVLLIVIQLVRENFFSKPASDEADKTTEACAPKTSSATRSSVLPYIEIAGCLLGILVAIYVFGIILGFVIFAIIYLKLHRESWRLTIILGVGLPSLIYVVFELLFHMILYKGIFLH